MAQNSYYLGTPCITKDRSASKSNSPKEASPGTATGGMIDKSEREFITTDDSGKEVKAKWKDHPPTHENYLDDQRTRRERLRNNEKTRTSGHKSAQETHDQKTSTKKIPAELPHGRKPKPQTSEIRQCKPRKNLGDLPVDLKDSDLKKNVVKPKRDKPTAKPTAKKAHEAGDRNEKPVTRKQESDIKKEENKKKPKKGQAELTQRKIAIEIVDVSDDDDAQSDSHGPNRASTSRKVAGKTQTLADKNKSDPSKQPNQGVPEDDQQTVRAVERKIVCLGPRSSIPESIKALSTKPGNT